MNAGLFLSLLTPISFLMLIFSVSSSPELVVLLWVWVPLDESLKSRFTYIAARMVQCLFIVLAREPKRTRLLPTVLDLRPGILPLSNRNQPPLYCARTVERPPASNFRTVHRYRFILRTWSNFKTLRGLVRKKSVLFGKTLLNKAKKRECSTGTTANKDRNYIDNCSSLSPAWRRTVWRPERKTTSPSRRWCQWEQLEYPPLTFFCR